MCQHQTAGNARHPHSLRSVSSTPSPLPSSLPRLHVVLSFSAICDVLFDYIWFAGSCCCCWGFTFVDDFQYKCRWKILLGDSIPPFAILWSPLTGFFSNTGSLVSLILVFHSLVYLTNNKQLNGGEKKKGRRKYPQPHDLCWQKVSSGVFSSVFRWFTQGQTEVPLLITPANKLHFSLKKFWFFLIVWNVS